MTLGAPIKLYFIVAATIASFALLLLGLGEALTPLAIAFGLAYLFFPLVIRLEKKGVPRLAAVGGVFVFCIAAVATVLVAFIPDLLREARQFFIELPNISERAIERFESVAAGYGYAVSLDREWLIEFVQKRAKVFSVAAVSSITENVSGAFRGILAWILAILNLFLIPVFFFYVINDYEKLTSETKNLVPPRARPKVMHYVRMCNEILSGYIRGQVVVALILAVLYGVGLAAVGLKFGLLVGILTGLFNVIPYVGFTLGVGTATILALAYHDSWMTLVGTGLVFAIVQGLESFVITPRLVGNKVGLSALAAMLALIVGGNLFGLLGMLLAIPVAAIIKTVLAEFKQQYFAMEFYRRNT